MQKTNFIIVAAAMYSLVIGFLYLFTAFVAPNMGGDSPTEGFFVYFPLALAIIIPIAVIFFKPKGKIGYLARAVLFFDSMVLVDAAIISWTGIVVWQVPFGNQEIFQVTMAFQDLIGAAALMLVVFFWEYRK